MNIFNDCNCSGLFGNSVFENEEIALNPIREVEYDYYDLDNALDGREEDLYSEARN